MEKNTKPLQKLFYLLLLLLFSHSNAKGQDNLLSAQRVKSQFQPSLQLVWETDTLLSTVESVIYDASTDLLYTANINGHFMARDGNGFISKVDLKGNIIEQKWIVGLDAPTGLGIHKGRLYTTDINRIVEIDISKGEIIKIYPVDGAEAFNDVAIGKDGSVYCSDTGGNQIFALKAGKVQLTKDNIDTPNGLLVEDNKILVTQWSPKTISSLDLSSQELIPFAHGIEGTDGLEDVGDGTYLASGFFGVIYQLAKDGSKTLLLDTSSQKIKAADIDYIPKKNLLLIPTMDSNKVMAYRYPLE